jgi:hypothetical protein
LEFNGSNEDHLDCLVDPDCDHARMRSITPPIEAPTGVAYVVEAIPRGAINSPLFTNEILQWTSSIPLLADVVGWLRHRLVYKGVWTIVVRPADSDDRRAVVHEEASPGRKAAVRQMADVVERIRRGQLQPS